MDALRARLVDDWKQAWRWASMRLLALSIALQVVLMAMPDTIRQYLPDSVTHVLAIVILAAGVAGRLYKQETPNVRP